MKDFWRGILIFGTIVAVMVVVLLLVSRARAQEFNFPPSCLARTEGRPCLIPRSQERRATREQRRFVREYLRTNQITWRIVSDKRVKKTRVVIKTAPRAPRIKKADRLSSKDAWASVPIPSPAPVASPPVSVPAPVLTETPSSPSSVPAPSKPLWKQGWEWLQSRFSN